MEHTTHDDSCSHIQHGSSERNSHAQCQFKDMYLHGQNLQDIRYYIDTLIIESY